MKDFENNALFWQKVDTLVLSSTFNLKYPEGSHHHFYSNLVYPVDYGVLKDSLNGNNQEINVYQGSDGNRVNGLIVSADILARDCVVKLLIGCTEEQIQSILTFLNQTEFQKTIYCARGSELPSWASADA